MIVTAPRPIWVLVLGALVVGVLSGIVFFTIRHDHHPGTVDLSRVFDFGEVVQGTQIEHTFYIQNPTADPWGISGVSTSCACTVIGPVPDAIPPRSVVGLPASMDTSSRAGSVAATVVVSLDTGERIFLSLKGAVIEELPPTIDFGDFRAGDALEKFFVYSPPPDTAPRVTGLQYDRERFDVSYLPMDGAVPQLRFRVAVKNTFPEGAFLLPLTIELGDGRRKIILMGRVLRGVEVEPVKISLGMIELNEEIECSFRIYSPYGLEVTVVDVISRTGRNLRWRVSEGTGDSISLRVSVVGIAGRENEIVREEMEIIAKAAGKEYRLTVEAYALLGEGMRGSLVRSAARRPATEDD